MNLLKPNLGKEGRLHEESSYGNHDSFVVFGNGKEKRQVADDQNQKRRCISTCEVVHNQVSENELHHCRSFFL